jgi:hypothetical protein
MAPMPVALEKSDCKRVAIRTPKHELPQEALMKRVHGTPVITVLNTLLFQAGGTIVDNPRFPPGGAPNASGLYARNQGLGTWSYDPATHQFDNFVDGVYDGYSTVDRELVLSEEGLLASGPVRSDRFKADGSLVTEVCGQAVSSRL